ncbi:MAG TPA: LD-carboxypeptidase [Candidatus Kapabacteria bacterium]|nr:LD-carboxypeptidase [Candidatus Kapabacteria bacterium]
MNNRRNLLKLGMVLPFAMYGCSSISNDTSSGNSDKVLQIIKAKRIKRGSKVALIAPASNTPNPDDLNKAIEVLNHYELRYEIAASINSSDGYKTKNPIERANDFNTMFANDEIEAIFCVRGGYGSAQILNLIDYDLIKSKPKILLGYSDITALHSAIFKQTGLITFHGPVMLSKFTDYTISNFDNIFFNDSRNIILKNPSNKIGFREQYLTRTINSGKVQGRLIGGNLSLISSLIGSKYQPDFTNKIVYLEDVGEAPYRIDRMLLQLQMAGMLDNIKGFVWGKCEECTAGSTQSTWDLSLGEVLDYYIKPLNIPSFTDLMIGHTADQLTLPNGCMVELDADSSTINLLESPFI